MDTSTLGQHLVRRLANAPELEPVAFGIADDLLALGKTVPADDWLIVGGSLARGEPCFIHHRHHGGPLLMSDVDFTYVHYGDYPSTSIDNLIGFAEKCFPTVDMKTLSLGDYRKIQTSLGHDCKNIGVPVTEHGLPDHEPVQLDARDAYEILLYYTTAYFWCGIHDQWLEGASSADFHLLVSRLCMKVLRATAMLDGAYAQHDFDRMPPHLAEQMRADLRWRAEPTRLPMDPGRFWSYVRHALHRFDAEFGRQRADAVTHTRYATTSSGRTVARLQQTVHELARAMADCTDPSPESLATVKQHTWQRITGWTGTRKQPSPEEHFRRHKTDFNHHLFEMKVQV